jgi:Cytochrome c7 and related cytochrome c
LLAAPHGLQPDAVRSFVWGAYANEYVAGQKKPQGTGRPLPGSGPAVEADVRNAIDREVQAMEKYLYRDRLSQAEKVLFRGRQTCGECHFYESKPGQVVPTRIMPTSVPEVWFQHARFDHAAHRAVSCRDCHPQAYSDAAPSAKATVMLPGRDVCLACHAPSIASKDGVRGGARFDCVECHRFHNGDQPLQGIGAEARGIPDAERRSIQEFLNVPRP